MLTTLFDLYLQVYDFLNRKPTVLVHVLSGPNKQRGLKPRILLS
jgi:hypothetical protein